MKNILYIRVHVKITPRNLPIFDLILVQLTFEKSNVEEGQSAY